ICLLEFLTLVPEEVSNAEILGGRRAKIIQELKNSLPMVLSTLSSALSAEDASIDIRQKAMTCFQAWIQYGIEFEDAYPLLHRCMILLENEDLFSSAVNVLVEAMPQSSWAKYTTLRNDLLVCFSTDWTRSKFLTCIHEEDEDAAQSLARLFTVYGETYTDFIVQQLADPKIAQLMDMVLQLTNFPGQYPVDQEVSEIPLNLWYVFEETLFDEGIVPVRNGSSLPIVTEDDASAVRTQEQMEWRRQCGEAALAIYRQLVSILKEKAVFPDDAVWETWPKDDMIAILLDHATAVLNQWTDPGQAARELEAILFSIKSISEEVAAEENVHIPRLLGPDIFGRLPTESNFRLQNTVLLLLGSLAEWLKVHPTFLPAVMNYIVPCLSVSKLAPSAAKAFSDMCDTCRESLVGDLDSLMHVYGAMARSCIPSVADVIQVLPPDRAMAPLMTLAGDILQGLAKALDAAQDEPNMAEEGIITQIGNLCACCRGIQSPSDDYQSISARHAVYDAFARGELTALYTNMEGFTQLTQAIQSSIHQIARLCSSNEQIIRLLCHFLELAIRATSPLLTLPFQDAIELIVASYQNAPFACWLQTARAVMTAYGGQESCFDGLRNMLGALTGKTFEFINKPEGEHSIVMIVNVLDTLTLICIFSILRHGAVPRCG
ncbi:armadillo-type protein, partial [Syncephalastrum racemosum]